MENQWCFRPYGWCLTRRCALRTRSNSWFRCLCTAVSWSATLDQPDCSAQFALNCSYLPLKKFNSDASPSQTVSNVICLLFQFFLLLEVQFFTLKFWIISIRTIRSEHLLEPSVAFEGHCYPVCLCSFRSETKWTSTDPALKHQRVVCLVKWRTTIISISCENLSDQRQTLLKHVYRCSWFSVYLKTIEDTLIIGPCSVVASHCSWWRYSRAFQQNTCHLRIHCSRVVEQPTHMYLTARIRLATARASIRFFSLLGKCCYCA